MAEAREKIDLLKEQTELMRRQCEAREGEWHRLSRPGTTARRAWGSVSRESRATTDGLSSQ